MVGVETIVMMLFYVYGAKLLSPFMLLEVGAGEAKEGLADVINIHSQLTNQIN